MKKLLNTFILYITSFTVFAQSKMPALSINHLTGNYYTYISYGIYKGQSTPANAMYLVTNKGIVLFDTPWNENYYQPLLDSISKRHHKKILMCISTHFHGDRTGGLKYYSAKGIKTYATHMTDSLCMKNNMNGAEFLIPNDTTFNIDGNVFQTYYPGAGHTSDNIVIWFPKEKILYGGCFIKSAKDNNLGFIGDGNVKEWGNSIRHVQEKFPNPNFIIVGHGDFINKNSLNHTLEMVNAYNETHK